MSRVQEFEDQRNDSLHQEGTDRRNNEDIIWKKKKS